MHRPRLATGFLIVPIAFALVFTTLACGGGGPESGLIDKFFRASKLGDNATMGNISAGVSWDKGTDGTVQNFDVVSVSEERVEPLNLKTLSAEYEEAHKASEDLNKRKLAYQDEHAAELKALLAIEGKGGTPKGKDAQFQAEWNKWRDDTAAVEKRASEARTKLQAERGVAEASLLDEQNPVDVTQYNGEVATKEYTINANVTTPDNQKVKKTLLVTLKQARMKGDKGDLVGKWVITSIKDTAAGTTAS